MAMHSHRTELVAAGILLRLRSCGGLKKSVLELLRKGLVNEMRWLTVPQTTYGRF